MTVDVDALEELMVEVGTPGPMDPAWVSRLEALMTDDVACLQLCTAVLHAILFTAVDAGLWPADAPPVGLYPAPREGGKVAYAEPAEAVALGSPRLAVMQAFTAAVNNEWDTARAVLRAHIDRGWEDAVPVVVEVMNLWRGHAAALLSVAPEPDPPEVQP